MRRKKIISAAIVFLHSKPPQVLPRSVVWTVYQKNKQKCCFHQLICEYLHMSIHMLVKGPLSEIISHIGVSSAHAQCDVKKPCVCVTHDKQTKPQCFDKKHSSFVCNLNSLFNININVVMSK